MKPIENVPKADGKSQDTTSQELQNIPNGGPQRTRTFDSGLQRRYANPSRRGCGISHPTTTIEVVSASVPQVVWLFWHSKPVPESLNPSADLRVSVHHARWSFDSRRRHARRSATPTTKIELRVFGESPRQAWVRYIFSTVVYGFRNCKCTVVNPDQTVVDG